MKVCGTVELVKVYANVSEMQPHTWRKQQFHTASKVGPNTNNVNWQVCCDDDLHLEELLLKVRSLDFQAGCFM